MAFLNRSGTTWRRRAGMTPAALSAREESSIASVPAEPTTSSALGWELPAMTIDDRAISSAVRKRPGPTVQGIHSPETPSRRRRSLRALQDESAFPALQQLQEGPPARVSKTRTRVRVFHDYCRASSCTSEDHECADKLPSRAMPAGSGPGIDSPVSSRRTRTLRRSIATSEVSTTRPGSRLLD